MIENKNFKVLNEFFKEKYNVNFGNLIENKNLNEIEMQIYPIALNLRRIITKNKSKDKNVIITEIKNFFNSEIVKKYINTKIFNDNDINIFASKLSDVRKSK